LQQPEQHQVTGLATEDRAETAPTLEDAAAVPVHDGHYGVQQEELDVEQGHDHHEDHDAGDQEEWQGRPIHGKQGAAPQHSRQGKSTQYHRSDDGEDDLPQEEAVALGAVTVPGSGDLGAPVDQVVQEHELAAATHPEQGESHYYANQHQNRDQAHQPGLGHDLTDCITRLV